MKGKPITSEDVALETGIPVADCKRGMDLLKSAEVGWIEPADERSLAGFKTAEERLTDGEKPPLDQRAEEEKKKTKAMSNGRAPERTTDTAPLPTAALPEIHAAQGTAHCQEHAGDAVAGTPSSAARTDGNARVRSFTPRLMTLQHGNTVLYDQGAATAIAKALCGRRDISPETQYAWAVETMGERLKTEEVRSVPAYFRDLLLSEKAPPEWVHAHRREQLRSIGETE